MQPGNNWARFCRVSNVPLHRLMGLQHLFLKLHANAYALVDMPVVFEKAAAKQCWCAAQHASLHHSMLV